MHELPVVKEILSTVLDYAKQGQTGKVDKVVLEIGEMHDLVPEWVEKFFRFASKGTIAEGAEIEIQHRPCICRCGGCGEHFVLHLRTGEELVCPVCGSRDFQILTGREFQILRIEVR